MVDLYRKRLRLDLSGGERQREAMWNHWHRDGPEEERVGLFAGGLRPRIASSQASAFLFGRWMARSRHVRSFVHIGILLSCLT
jgi:hypothetical protein